MVAGVGPGHGTGLQLPGFPATSVRDTHVHILSSALSTFREALSDRSWSLSGTMEAAGSNWNVLESSSNTSEWSPGGRQEASPSVTFGWRGAHLSRQDRKLLASLLLPASLPALSLHSWQQLPRSSCFIWPVVAEGLQLAQLSEDISCSAAGEVAGSMPRLNGQALRCSGTRPARGSWLEAFVGLPMAGVPPSCPVAPGRRVSVGGLGFWWGRSNGPARARSPPGGQGSRAHDTDAADGVLLVTMGSHGESAIVTSRALTPWRLHGPGGRWALPSARLFLFDSLQGTLGFCQIPSASLPAAYLANRRCHSLYRRTETHTPSQALSAPSFPALVCAQRVPLSTGECSRTVSELGGVRYL